VLNVSVLIYNHLLSKQKLYLLSFCLFQGLELKGQMVFCPESDSILFVGSPFLDGLDGLTGRGLFISDIPLHDATRDVILVGEQARAQVSYALFMYERDDPAGELGSSTLIQDMTWENAAEKEIPR
jgi:hypothetical protein